MWLLAAVRSLTSSKVVLTRWCTQPPLRLQLTPAAPPALAWPATSSATPQVTSIRMVPTPTTASVRLITPCRQTPRRLRLSLLAPTAIPRKTSRAPKPSTSISARVLPAPVSPVATLMLSAVRSVTFSLLPAQVRLVPGIPVTRLPLHQQPPAPSAWVLRPAALQMQPVITT